MTRKAPNAPKGATSPASARVSNKPKATTVKPDGKPGLVPKLRFPEFRDAPGWKQVALGDIAEIKLGKMLDKQKHTAGRLLPYLNNMSVRWNEVNTSNLPQMYFDDGELDRFGLRAGDVVVCEGGEPGRAAVWDGRMPDLKFQKAIHRVRFNVAFEARFLVLHLEKLAGTIQFEMLFTGGGIKHLTRETFAQLKIPYVPHDEQQKIAGCLSSLDELIAAQVRKLDALKTHKKALMQQLFPCEGETQPRLRFPEFQAAGEWVEKSLGGVARLRNGYAFKSAEYVVEGPYRIITIANVQQSNLTLESTKRIAALPSDVQQHQVLRLGDILISMTGNVGRVCRVTAEALLLNQRVGKLIPESINDAFFYQLLQRDEFRNRMQLKAAGGAQGNLSGGDITEYGFSVPMEPEEQQAIADCLTSLDDLIAAQTQKHEALKTQKKGLMQQLFPSPEEVEA